MEFLSSLGGINLFTQGYILKGDTIDISEYMEFEFNNLC